MRRLVVVSQSHLRAEQEILTTGKMATLNEGQLCPELSPTATPTPIHKESHLTREGKHSGTVCRNASQHQNASISIVFFFFFELYFILFPHQVLIHIGGII